MSHTQAETAPYVPSQEQMALHANRQGEFGWILDKLVGDEPDVRHAVAVSADGLLVARSAQLSQEQAERFAATVSGMSSFANGLGQTFGGGRAVLHTMVTIDGGGSVLIIRIPGEVAGALAVVTGDRPDIGRVGAACTNLVNRLGGALSVPPASAAVPGQRLPH